MEICEGIPSRVAFYMFILLIVTVCWCVFNLSVVHEGVVFGHVYGALIFVLGCVFGAVI